MYAGVALETGDDYSQYDVAFSANWANVADNVADAYAMYDAGTIPFVHVMFHIERQPDATIRRIADYEYDHLIEDFFMSVLAYCATGRKLILTYLPEMNGNWCPAYANDNPDPQAFIEAYRWFVTTGRDIGLNDSMVKWCWAPNNKGFHGLKDWYPGDHYVDIVGGSAYNWGGLIEGEPWVDSWPLFDEFVTEVRGFTRKPIVITQMGAGLGDKDTPEWLSRAAFYASEWTNILGWVWFNIDSFRYEPGVDDFNSQVSTLDSSPPMHLFEEETMEHTAMLWLPQALRNAGVNVVELDGWRTAQGGYYWTDLNSGAQGYDGEPTCYMVHHTAGSSAVPVVKDGSRWSKANCWAGLLRDDGKLYQSGSGVPTIVFTSAGPARVSSGYGHGPTLHEVADDVRVPWDQPNADTGLAANRYAWNVETVHSGDGSPLSAGVMEALVMMGALLCQHFDWSAWRAIGHLTWTRRKLDPYWDGRRDIIVEIQDRIAERLEPGVDLKRQIQYVLEGDEGMEVEYWQVRMIEAITGVKFYGNSNRVFVEDQAPVLEFKVWDAAMTKYLSDWTYRKSNGVGPTERVMIENAVSKLYN